MLFSGRPLGDLERLWWRKDCPMSECIDVLVSPQARSTSFGIHVVGWEAGFTVVKSVV